MSLETGFKLIFISVLVSVCVFQDNCPCNCFVVAYAKNLAKNPKNLWQKSLTKTLQKPLKNLVGQKLLYIFKHSNKQNTMQKTSMTWSLTNQAKNPETNQTIYTYMDSVGRIFKFESHPTKAFTYLFVAVSETVTKKEMSKILDGYIQNGIRQHDFVGGFQEAISKITI